MNYRNYRRRITKIERFIGAYGSGLIKRKQQWERLRLVADESRTEEERDASFFDFIQHSPVAAKAHRKQG